MLLNIKMHRFLWVLPRSYNDLFIICISAPCALGLLSLLFHIFCLCDQAIDLLTTKDFPQKTEILQL